MASTSLLPPSLAPPRNPPNPPVQPPTQSQVDLELEDPALAIKFPRFSVVRGWETTLEPGDMLYIPALWWHQVLSTKQSISINCFWGDLGRHAYLDKILGDCRREALLWWLVNVLEQNRRQATGPVFLDTVCNLDAAVRTFLWKQWGEEATAAQLEAIRPRLLQHLMATRRRDDVFYEYGDICAPGALPLQGRERKNYAKVFRIRGLIHREPPTGTGGEGGGGGVGAVGRM